MSPHRCIVLGAILAAAGVGLGAFGAHGLEEFLRRGAGLSALDAQERRGDADSQTGLESAAAGRIEKHLANWEAAVRYHLVHACALVLTGLLGWVTLRSRALAAAGWLFATGIALFSGFLYAMVLGGPRWFGAIVPIGGLSLIAGWLTMAWAARGGDAPGKSAA